MARHSFQPRNSLFPCFSLYFPTLRALLREISPIIFSALPFLHSVNAFPIRASLILHALHHLHLPIYSPSVPHPPPSSLPPHFLSLSSPLFHSPPQLNAQTNARTSRITRVRIRLHIPTRQEVFVYSLHRFTHLPQSAVHQHIRCEGKQEKAFTKYITISKATSYHKRPVSSTVNSICRRGEPHPPLP